jgi:hypothetical protein
MYAFVILTSILKTTTPYFRKHLLNTFESHEFLFLNTIFVSTLVLLFERVCLVGELG